MAHKLVFCLPLLLLVACGTGATEQSRAPRTASAPAAPLPDPVAAERDSLMQTVLRRIAGRENEPAESVFVNIQALRGIPARRLPRIMNMGFSRSLGVSCDHCHVTGEWEREDKPTKQIAREMVRMVGAINTEYLAQIPDLESEQPVVNCTTCHRGQVKPALNMPPS